MAIIWDIFDDADVDPTPEQENSWNCAECGASAALCMIEDRDEFGRFFDVWVCEECLARIRRR